MLLFLDLDGTLWDHFDASVLKPPFCRDGFCLVDSCGERLCLFDGVTSFLKKVYGGFVVSCLSWNRYSIVRCVLEELGIIGYFDYLFIEFNPFKSLVLEKALKVIEKDYRIYTRNRIVYVDDRLTHYRELKNLLGDRLFFIHMWVNVKDFNELYRKIVDTIEY